MCTGNRLKILMMTDPIDIPMKGASAVAICNLGSAVWHEGLEETGGRRRRRRRRRRMRQNFIFRHFGSELWFQNFRFRTGAGGTTDHRLGEPFYTKTILRTTARRPAETKPAGEPVLADAVASPRLKTFQRSRIRTLLGRALLGTYRRHKLK